MKLELIEKLIDPGEIGIRDEILTMPERSMQSNYKSVLLNLAGFIIGYLLLMNRFEDRVGCFFWFVVLPCVLNIISVTLYRLFFFHTKNRDRDYYSSCRYIIPGAFINFFAYSYIVVIYRSVPQVWIVAFMPVLLSCYYKGTVWFKVQLIFQCIFLGILFLTLNIGMPYDIGDVSPMIKGVAFALVMLQFSHVLLGQDKLKKQVYAQIRAEEARMEVRRVFEANLSNECQPYLDTIKIAAGEILNRKEEDGVHEYAVKLAAAGEALKEAVSEGRK